MGMLRPTPCIQIIAVSEDGTAWAAANAGLPTSRLNVLARDPSTPGRVYAAGGGVFRSDDGGVTWTTRAASFNVGPVALVVDAADPATLYAGTLLAGVQKSSDGGVTWVPQNDGLERTDVLALVADPNDPSVLYVGLDTGGLWVSGDGAASWSPTGLGDVSVRAIVVDPTNSAVIWAGTAFDGVFKSSDGGGTFVPASTGLTALEIHALAGDPLAPATLYAGTARDGVFRSTDGGASWSAFAVGLPPIRVASLVADPVTAGVVHAATRGVWRFEPSCPETCGTCEICDTLAGCIGRPRTDCRVPAITTAADLTIVNKARDTSDALSWRWTKGAATPVAAFGNPLTTDAYTLCVFDESTATPRLLFGATIPPGGTCGRKACWAGLGRPKGARGFRYADSKGTVQGITGITLTPGVAGKAKVAVKGKGIGLGLPTLPAPIPLRVQLEASSGACFDARYPAAGVRKNDSARFSARSATP